MIERRDSDGVVELRLAAGKTNALTTDLVRRLIDELEAAESKRAIVVAGGAQFFCNGLDLSWALACTREQLETFFLTLGRAVTAMLTLPCPIVGAVRGHAIGAGKTLIMACDHRLAASGRVLLGSPEITLGVPNPIFADLMLRLIVGDSLANDLLYNGKLIPADQLAACGLIQEIVAPEEVDTRARQVAAALGSRPRAAFAASKAVRAHGLVTAISAQLPEQIDGLLDAWFGHEAQQLLRAAAGNRNRSSAG